MSLWNNEDKADGNISTPEAAVSESTPETWAEEISADDEFDVTDDGIPLLIPLRFMNFKV